MTTDPGPQMPAQQRKRLPPWLAVARLVSGIALLTLGIVGLLLPVMPGWIFLIPGIALLSSVTPKVRQFLRRIRDRVPRRFRTIRAFFHRLQRLAGRKKR